MLIPLLPALTEGLAFNVREVRMVHATREFNLEPRPHPSGWLPEEVGARRRKQQPVVLEHLELGCENQTYQITGIQTQRWAELADLSALQTLELTALIAESGLDTISSLRFPALTALTFCYMDNPSIEYFDKVKRFLAGLPHLESLSIIGWDWPVAPLGLDLNSTPTTSNDVTPACHLR
ncbi:hypothetical protein QBC36DRAFT_301021 [Triangularia setosa]|uniref:Uncharacterized protein n=1 Tax=Triangularia setosa TaxID=2587417 RepID=A0AAN7A602_9PEZI|nr:hypothetical protein QBC36DRAFT_301021 [Podospora setosa]